MNVLTHDLSNDTWYYEELGQDKAEWLARTESALPSCYSAPVQKLNEEMVIC
jgi:hypothetical protein